MSLVLQFIFELFGFVFSMMGLFVLMLGFVGFLSVPIVSKVTGIKQFANLHLWLATSLISRAAIVVSEHGDLLLKSMEFDDLGVEKISFGDEEKEFEDPDSALHHWMGIPFALADEVTGTLFDPRHAALGQRKRDSDERGEYTAAATQDEWETFGVHEWIRGVFEMPTRNELVELGAVRQLVDGGERAEYPKRVEKLYQHSRDPFQSGTSPTKFIMIIVALLAPFAGLWLMASQGSGGGGGGSTVSYGVLYAILGGKSLKDYLSEKEIDWKRGVKLTVAVAMPLGLLAMLVVFAGPFMALFVMITFGVGFFVLPLLALLSQLSSRLSGGIARLLFRLGLLGYTRPVYEWTSPKYRLREADDMETTDDVRWYNLCGSLIGFSYEPSAESWGAEFMNTHEIEAKREAIADGGQPSETNIPADCARAPSMKRASSYAAFVPKRLRRNKYYLHSGIAQGRFNDSANGEKAMNRLLWAKEEYGGDNSISDKAIIYGMLGAGTLSFALGVFVFFL